MEWGEGGGRQGASEILIKKWMIRSIIYLLVVALSFTCITHLDEYIRGTCLQLEIYQ